MRWVPMCGRVRGPCVPVHSGVVRCGNRVVRSCVVHGADRGSGVVIVWGPPVSFSAVAEMAVAETALAVWACRDPVRPVWGRTDPVPVV